IRDDLVTGVQTCALPISSFGPHRLRLGESVLRTRPALRGYAGRRVALGIRPEDIEDAAVGGGGAGADGSRLRVTVDIREDMGSRSEERRVGKECRCREGP